MFVDDVLKVQNSYCGTMARIQITHHPYTTQHDHSTMKERMHAWYIAKVYRSTEALTC
jgi:hypothetical protein